MTLWVVVFSNYEPPEVDSIWCQRKNAEAAAAAKNGNDSGYEWHVEAWPTDDEPEAAQ